MFKTTREHNFDVKLVDLLSCRNLRWICHNHSNNVAYQVETTGTSTYFFARENIMLGNISFSSHRSLHYATVTCAILYSLWQCDFKKLFCCHRKYKLLYVAILSLAMQHLRKICRNIETSEYSGNLSISKFCHRNFLSAMATQ